MYKYYLYELFAMPWHLCLVSGNLLPSPHYCAYKVLNKQLHSKQDEEEENVCVEWIDREKQQRQNMKQTRLSEVK